jgi:hypothetical protein
MNSKPSIGSEILRHAQQQNSPVKAGDLFLDSLDRY